MNYNEVIKHLICDFKSEHELTDAIKKVSHGFTSDRAKIEEYLKDEKLIAAYTAFYFTSNYPKLDEVLRKIPELKSTLEESEVVEIGSGPGSFTFNFAKYSSDVFALETAPLMITQAKKLNEHFGFSNIKFCSTIGQVPEKKKRRILIFTNSSNEMEESEVLKYIKQSSADDILFIEPGTLDSFKGLLGIRSKLVKKFDIAYPCGLNTPCPLEDKDDWCHQYLKMDLDADFKRVSQIVKINRKWQATCIHFYTSQVVSEDKSAIVLRTFGKTKFSKDWQICEQNELKDLKNFKKDYTKDDYKALDEVLAGDRVKYQVIKELKNQELRVKKD